MTKYKEGRAAHQGSKKPDHPEYQTEQSSFPESGQRFYSRSSSDKQSWTPLHRNSEGQDHRQQDYHSMPYFPVGPPMLRLWGPPMMMYPSCPPWARWYGLWAPLPMHFHLGWSGPVEGFGQGGYYTGDDRYIYVSHHHDRRAS
jgi:hypothetical protein